MPGSSAHRPGAVVMVVDKDKRPQCGCQAGQEHTHGRQERCRRQHPQSVGQEGGACHAPAPHHACRFRGGGRGIAASVRSRAATTAYRPAASANAVSAAGPPINHSTTLNRLTHYRRYNGSIRPPLQHRRSRSCHSIHCEGGGQQGSGRCKQPSGGAEEEQEAAGEGGAAARRHSAIEPGLGGCRDQAQGCPKAEES